MGKGLTAELYFFPGRALCRISRAKNALTPPTRQNISRHRERGARYARTYARKKRENGQFSFCLKRNLKSTYSTVIIIIIFSVNVGGQSKVAG